MNQIMSEGTNNMESFDVLLDGESKPKGVGQMRATHIPSYKSGTLHMTIVILYLLQFKGL